MEINTTNGLITGIQDESISDLGGLFYSYPNPCFSDATFTYHVEQAGQVKNDLLNLNGKIITPLLNQYKAPGQYEFRFDASNISVGAYLARTTTDTYYQVGEVDEEVR